MASLDLGRNGWWRVGLGWIALALLAAAPLRAQDFDAVQIRTVDLGGGMAMLVGRGGNIGVCAGEDGVFLVDDQFAPLTGKILAAVSAIHAGPIRFVINTHWHGDHTGGNENLGSEGALIVAHDRVRERMGSEQFIQAFGRRVPPSPPAALPVVTFSDSVTFHLNGQAIAVHHVAPAHTDGDSIVHFRGANVIHMGDTFFAAGYPFIDLSSGGSLAGVIAAADRALALSDPKTRIVPGHGPLSTPSDLRGYRDMLATIRERVAAAIAAGRGVSAVIEEKVTADFDARWGGGFVDTEAFVRAAYASVSRERSK